MSLMPPIVTLTDAWIAADWASEFLGELVGARYRELATEPPIADGSRFRSQSRSQSR